MKLEKLNINGLSIAIEHNLPELGKPDKKQTILFIHGFPDDKRTWSNQINEFSNDYNVATIDLPGVSDSAPPRRRKRYKIVNLEKDIAAIVNQIVGKNNKIHLVGHDWGAIIGWSLISNKNLNSQIQSFTAISCPHPAIARNIVEKSFSNFNMQEIFSGLRQIRKSWYMIFFQLPVVPEMALKLMGSKIWSWAMNKADIAQDDSMRQISADEIVKLSENSINLYRENLSGFKELPEKIETPVCLIIPSLDMAIEEKMYNNTENYAKNLSKHVLTANHWLHRTNATEVNNILQSFWKG